MTLKEWTTNMKRQYTDKLTKQYFINEYIIKGRTLLSMAKEISCDPMTVVRYRESQCCVI